MKKNRKKSDTFRFNGVWDMKPIETDKLKSLIGKFQSKLTDPDDLDDKKWTARWLKRLQQELLKKEKSLDQKQTVVAKRRRWERSNAIEEMLPELTGG